VRHIVICLLLAGAVLSCLTAQAEDGDELLGVGAVQKSLGGAGAAAGLDATWALLNPAGLTRLESRLDVYADYLDLERTLEPSDTGLLPFANWRAGPMRDDSGLLAPGVGFVYAKGPWRFSAGAYAVEGNSVDFPQPRTIVGVIGANGDRRSKYLVVKTPLTVARDLGGGWSVGASLLPAYTRLRTDSLTLDLIPTRGGNRWDDAWAFGANVGVLKDWGRWSFGAAYATVQKAGEYDAYADLLKEPLHLPQKARFGLAYRPWNGLEVLADYKWIDWSGVAVRGNATVNGGLGWEDQRILKLGLVWQATERWTLRAGYSRGNSPVASEFVFANSLFPAILEDHFAAGVSYRFTDALEVHAAYMRAAQEEARENGRGDLYSIIGRGTEISMRESSFTAQLSYRF
jgi:long-chain fatty acid transport protein